jgi:hypothetical protein
LLELLERCARRTTPAENGKLDADWVILSACNTASGGAQGAEALSGLARAFFYAGARSLLVSHWEVNSDATVKLNAKAVAELKASPKMGPRRGAAPLDAVDDRDRKGLRGISSVLGTVRACW